MRKFTTILMSIIIAPVCSCANDSFIIKEKRNGLIDFGDFTFNPSWTIDDNIFSKPDFGSYYVSFPDIGSYKDSSSSSSSFSSSSISSSITSSSSSSLSSESSSYSYPEYVEDYFYCDKYGPFTTNVVGNFQADFTYELNSIPSQNIIERVRLLRNGSVVSSSSKASKSYMTGQRNTVSFLINLKDYWTTSGLEIRFEIISTTYTILKSFSASFYPPKQQTLPFSALKNDIYTSDSLGFYGDGQTMKEAIEQFDFTTMGDYLDNDYYYRLDLTKNTFRYPNPYNSLTYQNAELRFNDSEWLFPHLTHQSNDDVVIPLELVRHKDNSVVFKYRNYFYVNKRTLDISDEYRSGYAYTKDFYLPINGLKKFNGKTIYIDIKDLGMDRLSTTIPLKYQLNRTMVGTCSDGEYCVVGGSR